MRDLILQEKFEMEVLDRLNSRKLLANLLFGGGTMLRLCYGLDRFSVDLDFWVAKKVATDKLFLGIRECLAASYTVKDATDKFFTLVFEVRSAAYPRNLKVEIRKEAKQVAFEEAIAYSTHTSTQVLLNTVTLPEMMQSKIAALLGRGEIRDAFDMEFLLKRGVTLNADKKALAGLLKKIDGFTKNDYAVRLGSLLAEERRGYYRDKNFMILKQAIGDALRKTS